MEPLRLVIESIDIVTAAAMERILNDVNELQ